MQEILIGTANPYKQKRLKEIVGGYFVPRNIEPLEPIEERGRTFKEIAENKAIEYSEKFGGLAISTDGGAVVPALNTWEPLRTRRFGATDDERIRSLLKMMEHETNRSVEWHEALAIANSGKLVFSLQVRAMDGVIATSFDPAKYEDGIWLCSITNFPNFGGRNYFDLNPEERAQTEDSWGKLKASFSEFMRTVDAGRFSSLNDKM